MTAVPVYKVTFYDANGRRAMWYPTKEVSEQHRTRLARAFPDVSVSEYLIPTDPAKLAMWLNLNCNG